MADRALGDPDAGGSTAADYAAALRTIQDRGRFGIRLGLGRTRAILRALGDPQRSFRGALVAGTNGKGSVLALVGSALAAAGYRAGSTPKPHLVTYRERLQVAGRPVDPATFARLVGEVDAAAASVSRRLGEPTEFELLTAVVFRWFAEERVDLAVVEVGLGGRLDATHAWDGGVAVITNVDLDHMDRLGPTVRHIAREKAAIVERGDLAVTGASGDALAVVRRRARRLDVPLREVVPATYLGEDRDGIEVDLPGLGRTRVGLLGRHQAANVAVAAATLDALEEAGIATVPGAARRLGFAEARWPGRLELVPIDGRDVVLDGAHNPAGATALAVALDDLRPVLTGGELPAARRPRLTLVTAAMADKDVPGIAAALGAAASMEGAHIICTGLETARAMPALELARVWAAAAGPGKVDTEPDAGAALERALREADGPIVVAGSLYLVGDIRRRLIDDPLLHDPGEAPLG
ncbi:MAG TPA: Mur ligase family protein [Candidatus Binatia bacterium]|nr:Mur ligase family protein [Candidatus Binatia bacterium]